MATSTPLETLALSGGILALALGLVILAVLARAGTIFRAEFGKVDLLVAEYVRCRDFLMARNQSTAGTGLRNVEGGAFREAWQNFNSQLGVIRERYLKRMRTQKVLLLVIIALLIADAAVAVAHLGTESVTPLVFAAGFCSAVAWLLPGLAAWILIRFLDSVIEARTRGNSLIAPWPTDGGSPEKQFSAYEKFLPVEMGRPETAPAPEAL